MSNQHAAGCEYMPGARVRHRVNPEVQGTVTSAFQRKATGQWLYAIRWDDNESFIYSGDVLELGTLPAHEEGESIMTGDVTKLPKWAQTRIEVLEMRVREAEAKLLEKPESNTLIDNYDTPSEFLEQDAHVTFRLDDYSDDNHEHQRYVRVNVARYRGGGSFVSVHGGATLAVEPQSSNMVKIRLADR